MSGMLASVSNLAEARLVEVFAVDIIDLKQPAQGALGALPLNSVVDIVAALKPETVISATVGDLPMLPQILTQAVQAMTTTGVDFVKIGFFPGGDWQACISGLANLTASGHALIAVLFADTQPDLAIIAALQQAGFRGVMLDTMDKSRGSLTQLMSLTDCKSFVDTAKAAGLLTGLAGSLAKQDIPKLLPLQADYLGFRGALCRRSQRTAELDKEQVAAIRQLLNQ